jgi:glycosyltransferase involved in cell wall biosynthesis
VTEISVVLCTHDRSSILRRTLPAIVRQDLPRDSYEVIVVDNASSDDTSEVVAALACSEPNLRCVREDEVGLSAARNRGVLESSGSIVVFVDDDVRVDSRWLGNVTDPFRDDPDLAAVGGRVLVDWPVPRPSWLPDSLLGFLAACDPAPGADRSGFVPVGANMAFRRAWLDKVGPFKTSLGRRGRSLGASEEEELFLRLRAQGGRVGYAERAAVLHEVEAERIHKSWFVRRAFAQGRSTIVLLAEQRRIGRIELLRRALTSIGFAVVGNRALFANLFRDRRARFAGLAVSVSRTGCAVEAAARALTLGGTGSR